MVELLAPVGSMEALYAAVQNGANAVYLGGKLFNARQYASNFDFDELKEAVDYAHLRGVKVYVTTNILIDNSEMEKVIDYIRFLYEIDVDGIIVQDLGLALLTREFFPGLEVHGSTQMTINNLPGAEFLHELGFTRVVLARETPIDEIKYIHTNTPIELEAFIHGALCVSYSGQCLMSSMLGGRSGNRGTCAQPCRMASSLVDKEGNIVKDWDKKHVLSTRDLNTLEDIEEIVESGIISLKIEGRMKRPEYVATVVKNYRKALDLGSHNLTQENKKDVEQIFNRGFTKGLMFNDFGRSFTSLDRPDNRGVLVGKVGRLDKYKVYIDLEDDVETGDGLEFQSMRGKYIGIKSPMDGKKGGRLILDKPGFIMEDSLVYKTSSVDLLERAKLSYGEEKIKNSIDMDVAIHIGKAPKLVVKYGDNIVKVENDKIVEKSERVALSEDKIIEQLSKLGDSTYEINHINIDLDDNSFLPLSVLNALRREAVEKLDHIRRNFNNRPAIEDENFREKKNQSFKNKSYKKKHESKLSIRVSSLEQFNQLDLNKLDRIYLGFNEDLNEAISRLKEFNKEIYIWTDKILYQKDLERIRNIIKPLEKDLNGISVSNLGSLKYFKDNFNLKIHGDIGLNVFNSFTLNYLLDSGLDSITLSPELNLGQIKNINNKTEGITESIVYGYLPVMVTKHCPMALVKNCKDDKNCSTCNFAKGYGIKDRMNAIFYMDRKDGYSNIYNSVPIMVLDSLKQIRNSGISMTRLDFTIENEGIKEIQEIFYEYHLGNINDNEAKNLVDKFKENHNITKGHYFRGIM